MSRLAERTGSGRDAWRAPVFSRAFPRALVFALLLLLVQTAALLHPIEHLRPHADQGEGPLCSFCLAIHGLDSPLPSVAKVVAEYFSRAAPPVQLAPLSCPWRPIRRCARAPPFA